MELAQVCLLGVGVAAVAYLGHRAMAWMGRRGWVFYGSEPSRPMGTAAANALMEFETLFNPAVEHVLEYRRHGDVWVQVTGEDD